MPRRTPSGKKTAVADVEDKLSAEAEKKGLTGRAADAYTYGTLNKVGLKRGNKTTTKGRAAAASPLRAVAPRTMTIRNDARRPMQTTTRGR